MAIARPLFRPTLYHCEGPPRSVRDTAIATRSGRTGTATIGPGAIILERSEEIEELFSGEAGLFDDCSEGASLEVGGVNGDRDPERGPARGSEVVMAAGHVMERKASSLQAPGHL